MTVLVETQRDEGSTVGKQSWVRLPSLTDCEQERGRVSDAAWVMGGRRQQRQRIAWQVEWEDDAHEHRVADMEATAGKSEQSE